MSNDTIAQRIDLLQEQIDNLEKSGFFTEKEMDNLSCPLRQELSSLKKQFTDVFVEYAVQYFNLSSTQIEEGRTVFNELWNALDNIKKPLSEIEVIDAEILTPNSITA